MAASIQHLGFQPPPVSELERKYESALSGWQRNKDKPAHIKENNLKSLQVCEADLRKGYYLRLTRHNGAAELDKMSLKELKTLYHAS